MSPPPNVLISPWAGHISIIYLFIWAYALYYFQETRETEPGTGNRARLTGNRLEPEPA